MPAPREIHETFMRKALEEAHRALHLGEVPIGAVVVMDGAIIASGFNQPIHHADPTAHAEIMALREAAKQVGNYRLPDATLYVTIEPCLMCVGALLSARVCEVVYGADEPKFGGIRSLLNVETLRTNHQFSVVSGVLEPECRKLMQDFFRFKRQEV